VGIALCLTSINIQDRNVRITGIQEDIFPEITQRIQRLFTEFLNQPIVLELPHYLTEYRIGSFHAPHKDFIEDAWYREWVITIQLSDPSDYDGGDLKIGDEILPKEKGCVIIYNGGLTHEVTKVTKGIRYSLTECAGIK
jgi:predicted 2-oxoglutarate/Fe(II)-dependent dioxygenase YbiX